MQRNGFLIARNHLTVPNLSSDTLENTPTGLTISNYRIKDMTESTVTFSAKDYKNQGLWKEITISSEEFILDFNACSSKTFCQKPALWFAVVPKQEQKDDAL